MRIIFLTQSKITLVDDQDYARLNQFKWYATNDRGVWYAVRDEYQDGKRIAIRMHRDIVGFSKGDGRLVDHRDRDGPTGYRGVSWHKRSKKYAANISYQGTIFALGCFENKINAALAYDQAAIIYFKDNAILNFPEKREEYEQFIRRDI